MSSALSLVGSSFSLSSSPSHSDFELSSYAPSATGASSSSQPYPNRIYVPTPVRTDRFNYTPSSDPSPPASTLPVFPPPSNHGYMPSVNSPSISSASRPTTNGYIPAQPHPPVQSYSRINPQPGASLRPHPDVPSSSSFPSTHAPSDHSHLVLNTASRPHPRSRTSQPVYNHAEAMGGMPSVDYPISTSARTPYAPFDFDVSLSCSCRHTCTLTKLQDTDMSSFCGWNLPT